MEIGSHRDSTHAAVTGNPAAFTTTPLAVPAIDPKLAAYLAAYPDGRKCERRQDRGDHRLARRVRELSGWPARLTSEAPRRKREPRPAGQPGTGLLAVLGRHSCYLTSIDALSATGE